MPLDIEAKVIRNTRLSSDYNVIALAAPEIAAAVAPGQFVMVKPGRCNDPLLRRPFSVFEILRENGRVSGLTLLSKRVGVTTRMLLEALGALKDPVHTQMSALAKALRADGVPEPTDTVQ